MKLDEAIAIRQIGVHAPAHLSVEASRVIQVASAMAHLAGGRIEFDQLTRQDRERVNAVLICRLALACGKLNDWKGGEERKAA